jgi:2'-5' RNA ligase
VSRLFVAVRPSDQVRTQLEQLPRPAEDGVRWVRPEQWHVTLRFLGDADEDEVVATLGTLQAQPATATYGPAVSRLGRAVVCVPVRGLDALAAAVAELTAHLGEPPDPRPFAGHLTLARLHHRGSCRLAGHKISAEQQVTTIDLVASTLSSDGPTHRILATVPLGA